MKAISLEIPDLILLEPTVYSDERGYFFESFNMNKFSNIINKKVNFVQDNRSHSKQGVLRGLHYQISQAQGKLVTVTYGEVFDVAVDLRKNSPTFGRWAGVILSADNKHQLWIPEGFAHGFLVLSESAEFQYKVTNYWSPNFERCIRYNDPDIDIQWPSISSHDGSIIAPKLSEKDQNGCHLKSADIFYHDPRVIYPITAKCS